MSDVDSPYPQAPAAYGQAPGMPAGAPPAAAEPFFPPRPPSHVRRWVLIAAGALALVVVAAVGLFVLLGGGTYTVKGAISVFDSDNLLLPVTVGSACVESGGYDDIKEGAQVVISDASGKTLAIGTLSSGVGWKSDGGIITYCRFTFSVPGVKRGVGPYGLQVGHRDRFSFVEKDGEDLQLSLG